MMKSKEEFLQHYKITEEAFKAAQISWETLTRIHDDYEQKKEDYSKIGWDFLADILPEPKKYGVHLAYWRWKEPEHLIAKIIRKRTENYKKYRNINEKNYEKIVTDLVGVRGLLTFKEEWPEVHKYILSRFKNDPHLYLDDNIATFDNGEDYYFAEGPKAHIREGDNKSLYLELLGSENIICKQNYRSVHYVMKYHGIFLELQLRTLFEEALGEMDHKIRYPLYAADEKLNLYAGIINHLVGVADELGSFYLQLSEESRIKSPQIQVQTLENQKKTNTVKPAPERCGPMDTASACLNNVLKN